ncbi:MAG TPA: hypothetical protein VGC92_02330 [Phenylobacterium sp.]|jgi:hypothetical protein
MLAARLAQPAPREPSASRPRTRAAGLPTAVLRQAWARLWWSVRTHMADLHGLPRPPEPRWARLML